MPIYSFKNTETGEITEKKLTVSELDDFKKENPNLQVHFGKPPQLVSHTGSILSKTPQGWKEHLSRMKKATTTRRHKSTIHD